MEQAAPHRVRTLVTYGAAGGIAATFNAPIACAIFSMEVLIGRVQTDFLLVLLTSLSSCKVARSCLGNYPAFTAPAYDLASGRELPLYFLMGLPSVGLRSCMCGRSTRPRTCLVPGGSRTI